MNLLPISICLSIFGLALVLAAPGGSSFAIRSAEAPPGSKHLFGRDISGLNTIQSRHAAEIIAQAKNDQVGMHGCQPAITIALTESNIRILANAQVPQSLTYQNDGMGSDQDSIGLFQRRTQFYRYVGCSMKADCSTRELFKEIKGVKGWDKMDVATLCQKVQKSEVPSAYLKHIETAAQVCRDGGNF